MALASSLQALLSHQVSAQALVVSCVNNAQDSAGEGTRVFTELFGTEADISARRADVRLREGAPTRALEGMPISVKDLFDVIGSPTCAGSKALAQRAPARCDAPAVMNLRAAGAIIMGKTNMTEFAYSAVGLNPHFGTPRNPFDRKSKLIPGGSSSGAAVSVSDGMCTAALGTDTGGSVRIPAALCGLVGFKPTASRVRLDGVVPLSPSLDSVGPIAADVASCALLDRVLAGSAVSVQSISSTLIGVRLAVPSTLAANDTDSAVGAAFQRVLSLLSQSGATIIELPFAEFSEVPRVGAAAVIVAAEAYAGHRDNLHHHGEEFDPRVRSRLQRGASYAAWEYLDALNCRTASIAAANRVLQDFDGWLVPTVPIVAPSIAACDDDEEFARINKLLLRNPAIVNFLDGCAISIPCHRRGAAPVGLMLAGAAHQDLHILGCAHQIELLLKNE